MSVRLNGLNPLSYRGVNAYAPPEMVIQTRAPTPSDSKNFNIGTLWLDKNSELVYILVNLEQNRATWLRLEGAAVSAFVSLTGNVGGPVGVSNLGNINLVGSGTVTVTGNPATNTLTITDTGGGTDFDADSGTATPAAGILNVVGGNNINTSGAANTLTVNLNDVVTFQDTNAAGTVGVIEFGIDRFIHNRGTDNTFVGQLAGNFSLTTASATNNSGFGNNSLQSLTTGQNNCAFGSESLEDLVSGSNCIGIGFLAGSAYIGAESSNIVIGNNGTVGESNVIRIGTDGSGAGQQNECYIAGNLNPARNINLNDTNSAGTTGVISYNGNQWVHNYAGNGTASNIFIGGAGNFTNTNATFNIGIGSSALIAITTGLDNCAIGTDSLGSINNGSFNTALGDASGQSCNGNSNVFIGRGTFGTGNGDNNVLVGAECGNNIAGNPSSNNILIGYQAASAYTTTESSNIIIGNAGVVTDNNTIRIGTQGAGVGQQNLAFMAGIFGATVGGSGTAVFVDNAGQLGTVVSSERFKTNIVDLQDSEFIHQLRPVEFNYKKYPEGPIEYGLIAEEVEQIMPHLVSYDQDGVAMSVKYQHLPILLLHQVQRLSKRVAALEEKMS